MKTKTKTTWRKVKLGEVADIKMGQSPRSEFYNSRGEGLPFYQGVTDFGEKYPKKSIYCSQPTKIAEAGDVFFSVRAPVGNVNVAIEKSCIGRGVAALRMKNGNNDFLYFFLKNYERYFKNISGGTTYESINKDQIEDIELSIPEDPNEQKRIADVLSAFDEKIELNNKINQTLEQMAQAIFKEWFVKFKFPDHKKAKFVDSELGKIPKGWEVKNLGDILVLEYGEALTSINRKKGVIPVYGSSGLVGYHDKKLVNGPGIIIGRAGIPGSVYWSQVDFHCVDSTFYVETKISKYFVFYLLKRQNLKSLISGSAVPGINRNIIYPNRIVLPLPSIINDFEKIMSPIFLKIYKNKLENQKLASLRDLLLPKLMSGKILVKS